MEEELQVVELTDEESRVRFLHSTQHISAEKLPCQILTLNDSNDPSYTNLTLPYRVICRQRYRRAGVKQRKQFMQEIEKQEMSQSKALSGVRIHREFVNPVLVPLNPTEIIKLTPKQKFKLDKLMNE